MENSEILRLPYIMPSQAQKHVTHNEAIRQLDALVQLSVASMEVSTPPQSPTSGARYIVGANASGDWAGLPGKVVAYLDGSWTIFEPRDGWVAYVEDQNTVVVRVGEAWQDFPSPKTLNNLDGVGVGAQSDSVNKLAVASDASLFSHSGNGHQLKINKAEENQSASMLFQSNWTGHAEFGLAGSNDFQVKVSPDGNTFQTALSIDKSTGQVQFPLGAATTSHIDVSGQWFFKGTNQWVTFSPGGASAGNFIATAGDALEPNFSATELGPLLRKGSHIRRLLTAFRSSSDEISAINIRLVFRYFDPGQDWTDANMHTDTLFSANNLALETGHFLRFEQQISNYQCPQDGFLLMYLQPAVTNTSRIYVYSSTIIEVVSD